MIDSCAEGNSGCEHDCLHTSEGAVCSCRSGYSLQADGKSCEDVDECSSELSCCEHICLNTIGSYTCHCQESFKRDTDPCKCIADGKLMVAGYTSDEKEVTLYPNHPIIPRLQYESSPIHLTKWM